MRTLSTTGAVLAMLALAFTPVLNASTLNSRSAGTDSSSRLQISEKGDIITVHLNSKSPRQWVLSDFFQDSATQEAFLAELNLRLENRTPRNTRTGLLPSAQDTDTQAENDSFLQVPEGISLTVARGGRQHSDPTTAPIFSVKPGDSSLLVTDDLLSNVDGEYVVMYAIEGAPLLQSLDVPKEDLYKPANIIRKLGGGEPVAVFSNAPRWVETEGGGIDGKNLFVWAMGGGISQIPGYVPLFYLTSGNPAQVNGNIELDVPYNLLSRMIADSVQAIFYKDCYELHPETGKVGNQHHNAPLGQNYYCGQYPLGNSAHLSVINGGFFRHLTTKSITAPEIKWQPNGPLAYPRIQIWDIDPEGAPYDPYNPLLYLDFPVHISNHQLRSNQALVLNKLTDDTVSGVASNASQTYSFGHAAQEPNALVHPMDISIRHYYETQQTNPNTVQVEIQLNLPGFEICQPWTQKEIVLSYWGLVSTYKEARTLQFTLGCFSIGSLPLRIHGEIALEAPAQRVNNLVSNGGAQIQKGLRFKSVQFVQLPSVAISAPVGVKFSKNELPDGIQQAIEKLLDFLNNLAQYNTGYGSNLGGLLIWSAVSDQIADMLLDQLEDLGDRLSGPLQHPRDTVREDCDRLFPTAYQNSSNMFYPIYKLCRTSAMGLSLPTFINPPDVAITHKGGYRELADSVFAPVNLAGIPWASPSTTQKGYLCPDDSLDCHLYYQRPWYAKFNPQYVLTGTDMFNPNHYQYQKGGGVSIGMRSSTVAPRPVWNLMRCLTPTANASLAHNPDLPMSWHRQQLQQGCFVEALGSLCELYGNASALTDMWEQRYGVAPKLGGYTNYCSWYEAEKNPDSTPGWQGVVIGNG